MNKRAKKKVEKRRRALVHQILDVVLDINGTGCRKKEYTGNMPTAFFEFSGHTSGVRIEIYGDGWGVDDQSEEEKFSSDGYLCREWSVEYVLAKARAEAAALREKGVIL